jgi:receptor protein-tyrosine kinase
MSIIEKAANKLVSTEPVLGQPDSPAAPAIEKTANRIEAAMQRERLQPEPREPQPAASARPDVDGVSSMQVEIDLKRLAHMGGITPDSERSQIAEEFRLIKRPLLANAFGQGGSAVKNGNLIMVTSSLPGEGKSFCSINLAISIASEMERTVLLVDADVARPRLPEYLGVRMGKGLLDVLRDESLALSDVMLRTNIPKLSLLPAGRSDRHGTELLASSAMTRLISDLANRYPDRVIIFDSPPLLSTSEASVLATHMGQIVMVVEAERTSQEALKEALGQIESCEVIGMVLNKATALLGNDNYYGYYGSYGK